MLMVLAACGGSGGGSGSPGSSPVVGPPVAGNNVLSITVKDNPSYPNEPCVSVTICAPGTTTNCQQIDDILLISEATGSASLIRR